jgi:hypothetical protein
MILKHHIELLKHLKESKDIVLFLDNFKGVDKVKISRSIKNDYPLKPKSEVLESLKKDFKIYTSINDLVLGQFIMLEQIITGKTRLEEWQIDVEILKLILRPKHHKNFDNENPEDEKENEYKILNTETLELYGTLNVFLENRNKTLFKDFAGVFYDLNEEDSEDDESKESDKTSEMLFQNQWYWYSIVRMLAQEDIRRYSEIYMLPMSIVLPEMSYLAQKNKIEDADRRQQQALRKL